MSIVRLFRYTEGLCDPRYAGGTHSGDFQRLPVPSPATRLSDPMRVKRLTALTAILTPHTNLCQDGARYRLNVGPLLLTSALSR